MCVTVRHRLRLQRKIIIIFIIYLLNTQLKLTVVMQASRTERHTVLLTYAHNITSTVKRNIHSTIHGIGVTRNLIISTEVWILRQSLMRRGLRLTLRFLRQCELEVIFRNPEVETGYSLPRRNTYSSRLADPFSPCDVSSFSLELAATRNDQLQAKWTASGMFVRI